MKRSPSATIDEKEKALQLARDAVKFFETDAINKPHAARTLTQIQPRFGDFNSAIADFLICSTCQWESRAAI